VADRDEEEARLVAKTIAVFADLVGRPIESLAADSGLSADEILAIFDGRVKLEIAHVLALSKALRIHPAELFTLAFPRRPSPNSDVRSLLEKAQKALGIRVPEEDDADADGGLK
jgi:hypothetical protein